MHLCIVIKQQQKTKTMKTINFTKVVVISTGAIIALVTIFAACTCSAMYY